MSGHMIQTFRKRSPIRKQSDPELLWERPALCYERIFVICRVSSNIVASLLFHEC